MQFRDNIVENQALPPQQPLPRTNPPPTDMEQMQRMMTQAMQQIALVQNMMAANNINLPFETQSATDGNHNFS